MGCLLKVMKSFARVRRVAQGTEQDQLASCRQSQASLYGKPISVGAERLKIDARRDMLDAPLTEDLRVSRLLRDPAAWGTIVRSRCWNGLNCARNPSVEISGRRALLRTGQNPHSSSKCRQEPG